MFKFWLIYVKTTTSINSGVLGMNVSEHDEIFLDWKIKDNLVS